MQLDLKGEPIGDDADLSTRTSQSVKIRTPHLVLAVARHALDGFRSLTVADLELEVARRVRIRRDIVSVPTGQRLGAELKVLMEKARRADLGAAPEIPDPVEEVEDEAGEAEPVAAVVQAVRVSGRARRGEVEASST